DELKSILKKNQLPVSGKKNDLIIRISESADIETYEDTLKKVWLPTEQGEEIIESTDYIMYTHRNLSNYITVVDAYNTKKRNPNLSDKEILLQSLENAYKYEVETSRYNRNLVFPLWEASKVCRNYEDFYGQYIFLIKSCVSNFSSQEKISMDYLLLDFDYFLDTYKIPEIVTKDLKMLLTTNAEYKAEISSNIDESISSLDLVSIFTASEIKDSITFSMNLDEDNLISLYKKVFNRSGGKKSSSRNKSSKNKKSIFSSLNSIYNKFKN
ncbi:MAG: SAP domain-containing protein, partial [Alkalibacterium sp.]|nr:SAP domain-containing protein [Alkalibacterium sp.]